METVHEEILEVKAKISNLEDRIAAAERGGRSEEYIINLGQQLVELRRVEVELRRVEVELRKKENIILEQTQASNVFSPGDSNTVFLVVLIERGGKKMKSTGLPPIIKVTPVGTAFSISETHVFTASHNTLILGRIQQEIGLLTVYEEPILMSDIIVANFTCSCEDADEDWVVYSRSAGNFSHYAHICPENELPAKNDRIGIRDFPVGLAMLLDSTKEISVESFGSKVYQYEVFVPISTVAPSKSKSRKRKRNVVVFRSPIPDYQKRALTVVGGRVKGSCGAGYFEANNKVVAFHVESVDDGSEEVSVSNSYTSDRSHTSYSRGLVICRLPKFKAWYNQNLAPVFGGTKL